MQPLSLVAGGEPPTLDTAARSTYRVIAGDLLTGRVYSRNLPLRVESLSQRLNGTGELRGTVRLDTDVARKLSVQSKTTPRKTFLCVEVAGRIVWSGIVWPRDFTTTGSTLTLSASTLDSILAHREIRDDLIFNDDDRWDIARALVAYAQGKPHGEAGIVPITTGKQGTRSDRTEWTAESHKKVRDALAELAATDPPFDWAIGAEFDPEGRDGITFGLRLGAPLGSDDAPWVFRYPGNVTDYTWSEDGSSSANDMDAIGSGEGDAQPMSSPGVGVAQDDLDVGFPLMEDSESYDVASVSSLNDHARADVAARAGDRVVCKVQLRYSESFAGWGKGDYARLMLTSPFHPPLANGAAGFDGTARMTGWDVTMPKAGDAGKIDLELEIA